MNIGWNFPVTTGGAMDGFNNAAMDHFKGDRTASIVRETIQNSLDVRQDQAQPVLVAFSLNTVDREEMPEISSLKDPLTRSKIQELVVAPESSAKRFYDQALDQASSKIIPLLGIHDFNTTGLGGPIQASKDGKPGGWLALVKGAGLSIKSKKDAGGSFGHGSKAPLAASHLRTAFYYTEVVEDGKTQHRYQGKTILQSHFNKNDEQTQATGYYGLLDEQATPLLNDKVPKWAKRLREQISSGHGTSIYIPFPYIPASVVDALTEIKLAVFANFYYAILTGTLVVHIGDEVLNSQNVADKLRLLLLQLDNGSIKTIDSEKVLPGLSSARTILNPTETGTFDSKTFGRIVWFIRTGDDIEGKAVGLSRNGMLITRSPYRMKAGSFAGTKPFDLFISVEGKGSAVMKSLENPEHNSIEPERIDDLNERREKLKDFDVFVAEVKELVSGLALQEVDDETSVSDLDDLFGGFSNSGIRSPKGRATSELVIGRPKRTKPKEGEATEIPDPDSVRPGRGSSGGEGAITTPGGDIPDQDGTKDIQGTKFSGRQVRDFRVIRQSKTKNVVSIFFTPFSKGEYRLFVFRSGETEREPIPLRVIGDAEWNSSVKIQAVSSKNRVHLEVEVEPVDFNFALEGVISDAN